MTFAEYLDAIARNRDISHIEEHSNGRYSCHFIFGFCEDDEDYEEPTGFKNDYILDGSDGDDAPTFIDTAQQIEFATPESGIYVVDREGNRLRLVFFEASAIPNPSE